MRSSFGKVFMGAAGSGDPSDDEFNRVSFLSHFEGSNNGVNNAFDDGSTSNHTITANGNATQGSFGPFAREEGYWGVTFDGSTTGYISVPTDTDFDLTNATTLEFWVFIPEDQTDVLVLGRHNLYWFGADYAGGGGSANKFSFLVMPDGSSTFSAIHSSANIVYNQWYFVQLIYSGTTVTFYLDGASQGTLTSFTPEAGLSKPFYVGGYAGQLNANSILSNIRFSNVARSTSVPTAPFAIDSNTKLLLCSSNRFTDRSSQAAVVSSYAGASVTAFGPFLTSAVYDPAVNGASAFLDGNGDYLTIAASNDFDLSDGDITYEFFAYPTSATSVGGNQLTVFEYFNSGQFFRFIIYDNNVSLFQRVSAGDYALNASGKAPLNAWTHVAITRASNNEYKIFCNGVLVANSTNSIAAMNTASLPLVIGLGQLSPGNRYFPGYISDFRLTKGSLVYTSNFSPPTAPLTAITNTKLLLNMADGQAIDSAAQNNLTLFGNAKISTGQAKFGNTSLVFDGAGDAAEINSSNVINFGSGPFTIEMFLRLDSGSASATEIFFDGRGDAGTQGLFPTLEIKHTDDTIDYYVDSAIRISSGTLTRGQFYHVAVCRSGTSTKMFIDGTQVGNTYSDSNVYISGSEVQLGRYFNSTNHDFHGEIDELRISKMARYTSNFTAPTEPFADKGK